MSWNSNYTTTPSGKVIYDDPEIDAEYQEFFALSESQQNSLVDKDVIDFLADYPEHIEMLDPILDSSEGAKIKLRLLPFFNIAKHKPS